MKLQMFICPSFPDACCKRCIISLMKRISEAYEIYNRQNEFVIHLMQLDVPNLFSAQSPNEDDQSVQKLFIDMICTFIQKNALKEIILGQVNDIMVCK